MAAVAIREMLKRHPSATVAEVDSALACAEGIGRLKASATHITISEPEMDGDTARITVTALFATDAPKRPAGYETIQFTLVRGEGSWRVVKQEQLGIS